MDFSEFYALRDMVHYLHATSLGLPHVGSGDINRISLLHLPGTGCPPLPFPFPENSTFTPVSAPPRFTDEDEKILAAYVQKAEETDGDLCQVMEHLSGVSHKLFNRYLD